MLGIISETDKEMAPAQSSLEKDPSLEVHNK